MITIPESELSFVASRASGPGGQNVNKVETRVSVIFDFKNSSVLTDVQKRRIAKHTHTRKRLDSLGRLVVSSQVHRTQGANKLEAHKRLEELVSEAIKSRKTRRPTKPSRSQKRKRTDEKRHRGAVKGLRAKVSSAD